MPPGETTITSLAGAGTYLLEFGMLSRLTDDSKYENAAKGAMRGLWACRSRVGLVGNHIDVWTGQWKYLDSGIGTLFTLMYFFCLVFPNCRITSVYLHKPPVYPPYPP